MSDQCSLSSCVFRSVNTTGTKLFATRIARLCTIVLALYVAATSVWAQTPTAVPVPTWRYDLTHAGQNTNETLLTPANVNPDTFGKLFSVKVDSTVYPQPLYVPSIKMSDGLVHNVLFVATSNDSVYAFDADSNGGSNSTPIWQISLLTTDHGATAGATAVPYKDTGSPDVAPTVGITGTPVINLATNTMYLVANTKENGAYYSRLHAINITTGAEQANSPVEVTATVAGTGNGSSGGQLTFSALWENQRTALNYFNGHVYFGYGAHGDFGPWHGWLFSYDATTLQQTDVLCLTPNGVGAGLWAAGAGLPIDNQSGNGRMFVVTGNGTRSTFPPFNANSEFGESFVAFDLTNGKLTPTDEFTSFNYETDLNKHDWDQGSGGILMVPDQQGTHPHVLVSAGKEGRILVLDRDKLGGYAAGASSNTNALQDISTVIPQGVGFWSTPTYWNGHVYMWAEKNVPMMFNMSSGVMDAEPDSQSTITSAFPDPTFSVSSDGAQDGIAWAVRSDQFNTNGPGVLYAWDATDLTETIYESDSNEDRDSAGPANKFSIPVVTNGKVYVAGHGQIDVYGLLNGTPTAAAPVISPNGGTFSTTQTTVTLTTATNSAQIFYTLDGSTPTAASSLYTDPITISSDTVLKAMASAPGYVQSSTSTATFNFTGQVPAPTFSPAGGTFGPPQTVTISDTDKNAQIYYTLDGTAPSASSTLYSAAIQVAGTVTINAIAIDPALKNSNVVSSTFIIQNGGTTIDFSKGFADTSGLTLNGNALANNDTRLQLTDGNLWEASSVFWNAPINVQAFTTVFTFQLSNAVGGGNGFTFTIQNNSPTALGGSSAGLGYQDIPKSVAVKFNFYNYNGEGDDSTGIYTNGQPPVTPSIDISPSGIQLNSDDALQATLTYDGTTLTLQLQDQTIGKTFTTSQAINIPQIVGANTAYVGFTAGSGGLSSSQKLTTWTYATQSVPPVFAPGAGTYTASQNVSLTSPTADAAIYYTIDGTTPTGLSKKYTGPIAVANSATLKAIAISSTLGSSVVTSAAYTINITPPPTPTFALSGTAISIPSQGANATSTITITPSGGFTGSVALACAVTATPANAVNLPTCSLTNSASVSGSQAVTTMLTVNTTGSSTALLHNPLKKVFTIGGGTTLAAFLFLCVPFRRRKWQSILGLLMLGVIVAAASGCSSSKAPTSSGSAGTTAGAYTITVTGTSGAVKASTTVALTVQ